MEESEIRGFVLDEHIREEFTCIETFACETSMNFVEALLKESPDAPDFNANNDLPRFEALINKKMYQR